MSLQQQKRVQKGESNFVGAMGNFSIQYNLSAASIALAFLQSHPEFAPPQWVKYVGLGAIFVGAVLGSTWLVSRIGALRTLQIGILCLAAALGTMCFAQWHAWLLYGALLLASGAGLTVLPVLRVLITQVGPTHT